MIYCNQWKSSAASSDKEKLSNYQIFNLTGSLLEAFTPSV